MEECKVCGTEILSYPCPDCTAFAKREQRWESKVSSASPVGATYQGPNSDLAIIAGLDIPETPSRWTTPICSFCNRVTAEILCTRGEGTPKRYVTEEIHDINGELEITEKVVYVPTKMIACPECAHLIRNPRTVGEE